MARGLEGDERVIQALPLPVGLGLPPAGGVTSDSVNELVMPDVLRGLVGITAPRSWCADERQANGVVVRLVRSVLDVYKRQVGEFTGEPVLSRETER